MTRFRIRGMLLAAVLGLIIISSSVNSVSAYTPDESKLSAVFNVTILDAGYSDMDGGIDKNDVYVILEFNLGYALYYEFDYYITLTLPSGISYTYFVWVIAWVETIQLTNIFYNHATESGNYSVYIDALMYYPEYIWDYDFIAFDPPGGSAGGDPEFLVY